jgi:hypothetical protein
MYNYFNKLLITFGKDLIEIGQISKLPIVSSGKYIF